MSTPAVQMDEIAVNGGGLQAGPVAMKLMQSNFNVNALRTNTILSKDEWLAFDNAVVGVARQRLVGVGDLMSRGLTLPLANALGVTAVQWEQLSDMTEANVSMDGLTPAEKDRLEFTLKQIPIPIVHKDFSLNVRTLEASRRNGLPIDTTTAELATRVVSEKVEQMLFAGSTLVSGSYGIKGLTNATNRNTGSVVANWATAATGAQIVSDVVEMIGVAHGDNMFGPYVLYVPTAVYAKFSDDFKAESDRTILERIRAIPEIVAVLPSANLSGTNVLLVQVTKDVVDIIDGIQPAMVMWDSHGGFQVNFKVLAIIVPRVKDTAEGQSGIVHYS
jgi:uncharacterized linocin/CFP29 family protein